jgi:hypothetical protein
MGTRRHSKIRESTHRTAHNGLEIFLGILDQYSPDWTALNHSLAAQNQRFIAWVF